MYCGPKCVEIARVLIDYFLEKNGENGIGGLSIHRFKLMTSEETNKHSFLGKRYHIYDKTRPVTKG